MIPYGRHHIFEDDIQAVVNVLRSNTLTQGPFVEQFEQSIANYVGANFAVAVSSGTAALHLSVLAAGIGSGDTLLTSPISFIASANAGLYAGANVSFVDIDSKTINLSPEALAIVLQSMANVKAVIPVHYAGLACDMRAIKKIADSRGVIVIEDAAHALGATYPNGRRVGCCDDSLMTVFSFHPVKAVAAGEGGMITTNDKNIYRKLLRLRSHGINKLDDEFRLHDLAYTGAVLNPWYYEMQELGFNFRITDIQSALGNSQLEKLNIFIERRKNLALNYDQSFFAADLISPAQPFGRDISAHHIYPVKINFNDVGITRADLMNELRRRGIGSQVHYIPIPSHPYYRSLGASPDLYPNALNYYEQCLSIPLFYGLTDQQQKYVISTIKDLLK